MARPIARKDGICFAFPDLRKTPIPPGGTPPMPYPNVAQLADAVGASADVRAGGKPVILEDSSIGSSSGGEPGSAGPVSQPNSEDCIFTTASGTVLVNGKGVVRQGDQTEQDKGNAKGSVMVGFPSVLVGD
ncbi:PAAR-like domain-containing protein [Actinoplanes sp. NPDC049596]|uniref:PAAR-like domain-containing protein n=1 Tax=unclassified Actinoplanes TaxID=2626549 RepID=UPI0034210A89